MRHGALTDVIHVRENTTRPGELTSDVTHVRENTTRPGELTSDMIQYGTIVWKC